MEEAVAQTASKLVPLLVVLGVIFGGLIGVALLMRARVRRETGARPVRPSGSVVDLQPDDVLSVLGRTFSVQAVESLAGESGAVLWCVLGSDDGPARTALWRDLSQAVHFPGRGTAPNGEAFPERIDRDAGSFTRIEDPIQLGQGWRLARYQGAGGRWLAVEQRAGEEILWRGKEIPVEGVMLIEEEGQP